jgi:hypothetical protein
VTTSTSDGEYGLEAAEHALAEAVAVETRRRIDTGDLSPSECRLVVRLWLASRSGVLAELLRRAQVVEFDLAGVPDPERAACDEVPRGRCQARGRLDDDQATRSGPPGSPLLAASRDRTETRAALTTPLSLSMRRDSR